MRHKIIYTISLIALLQLVSAQDQPNIIFILTDDHGWHDSEPYGNNYIQTPNMTRLAKESMLFTNAFAPSPLCSPSRCAIATGIMPHRNGGHFFGLKVKPGITDMPGYFNELGYHTVALGKVGYWLQDVPGKTSVFTEHIPNAEKAYDYILNYKDKKPLYLSIGTQPPHLPWVPNKIYDSEKIPLPPNYVDTKEMRLAMADYYMDVTVMDQLLGSILDALEKSGLKKNTLLVFTSDQGAHLPFAKWCVSDGGLRVPFMASWPGKIKPGTQTNAMINLVDILPTVLEAAGESAPDDLDGKSILPVLNGTKQTHRDVVFGSHSGNKNGPPGNHNFSPMRSIRTATHRYIFNVEPERLFNTHVRTLSVNPAPYYKSWQDQAKTDAFAKRMVDAYEHRPPEELYDLRIDPYEMKNLAKNPEHTELLDSLRKQLSDWCQTQNDEVASKKFTAYKEHVIMYAIKDFPVLEVEGFVPANTKGNRKVLSVNAGKYKGKFAAVQGTFQGKTGKYNITINTMNEFDGESTYKVKVDGELIGEYQNPRVDKSGDFSPSKTSFDNITVKNGATIQVEFNSHTNGLIPERNSTAYARGRWSSVEFSPKIHNPSGLINLVVAPKERFEGKLFLLNDWDGGDKDNQNVGEELNRNPKIKNDVTILSDLPDRNPRKVDVNDLVKDAAVLAAASKKGKIAIAMGAHSRHMLAWLTALPGFYYDYKNITIVTHSNWNELDGRKGYNANKNTSDPPLEDTHGVGLRRGLYLNLARLNDLDVTILEIPRTDNEPGGWGGKMGKSDGDVRIKTLDISDLGLVHYLKTGQVEATTSQRNQFVSDYLKKPATVNELNRELITRYWDSNHGVQGDKKDYQKGGRYFKDTTIKYFNPSKTEELRARDGLPNFFQKLKAGEDVKVGYFGGSITNGGLWRTKSIEWLKQEYPKANISQINAAMGGKGADFGACRIKDHLLVHDPDMIFIEYRVNNGGAFQGRSLEGMIPQIWEHDPDIEICIVYTIAHWMIDEIANGNQTSAGVHMEPVANHYGIPSIEFGLEVMKQVKEDKLVFKKGDSPAEGKIIFSNDGVHPIEAGHEIYKEILARSLKAMEYHGTTGANQIPSPLNENIFSDASLLSVNEATFSSGWKELDLSNEIDINADVTDKNGGNKALFEEAMQTTKEGESFAIDWDGFLLGLTSTQAAKGVIQIEVSTDGGPKKVYDLESNRGNVRSKYTFLDEGSPGKHTTTVKLVKLAPGIEFQLGQFLEVKSASHAENKLPTPATGYQWKLIDELSDEFEGKTLDEDKWANADPKRWTGRAPGLFLADAVSVDDGKMRITTDKLNAPVVRKDKTFTHQGGHVYSKSKVKPGSYVECRMKANKTFMSSTFWLNNYPDESTGCQSRVTELDIQECIGYPESHPKTLQMGSNTHSRGIPEACRDIPKGSEGAHCATPGKVYDHYFTYGVWWKSPTELLFYLNGEYKYTITPKADFDIPTNIKMVVETYNWSPVPEDGGMTGTWEDRTTYYDWVRTYEYVATEDDE